MNLNFYRWMPQSAPSQTLVFLHGMGGTGYIWRPIAAQLEDSLDCLAPDQRGHGLSRPVPALEQNLFHAEDYARDVSRLLVELKIDSYFLIGHSMGVRTALALAHSEPQRVKGVIAVDIGISSAWGGGIGKPLADFLGALPESFSDRATLREYLFKHCPDPAIAQYLSAVAKLAEKKTTDAADAWVFPFDHKNLVQTIEQADQAPIGDWVMGLVRQGIRVLFLRGANSKVWLEADYEEQKKTYSHPLLEFETWENCGHGLPFEQRARFVERIKSFVQDFINLKS